MKQSFPMSTRMAEVEWPESPVRGGGDRHQDSHSGSLAVSSVEPTCSSRLSHTWGNLQNEGGHSQETTSKWELRNIQLAVSSHWDKNQNTRNRKSRASKGNKGPTQPLNTTLHTEETTAHWIMLSVPTSYCDPRISSHTAVEGKELDLHIL